MTGIEFGADGLSQPFTKSKLCNQIETYLEPRDRAGINAMFRDGPATMAPPRWPRHAGPEQRDLQR